MILRGNKHLCTIIVTPLFFRVCALPQHNTWKLSWLHFIIANRMILTLCLSLHKNHFFSLKKDFLRLFSRYADDFPHSLSHILTAICRQEDKTQVMKKEKWNNLMELLLQVKSFKAQNLVLKFLEDAIRRKKKGNTDYLVLFFSWYDKEYQKKQRFLFLLSLNVEEIMPYMLFLLFKM